MRRKEYIARGLHFCGVKQLRNMADTVYNRTILRRQTSKRMRRILRADLTEQLDEGETMLVNNVELSDRTLEYIISMLWSSRILLPADEGELVDGFMDVDESHPLHGISEEDNVDDHFDKTDFDPESLRTIEAEVTKWFELLDSEGFYDRARRFTDDAHIAHDFWLTRNGHGAGYWDGDYKSSSDPHLGTELTAACRTWGEQHVYVDEAGTLYLEDN